MGVKRRTFEAGAGTERGKSMSTDEAERIEVICTTDTESGAIKCLVCGDAG